MLSTSSVVFQLPCLSGARLEDFCFSLHVSHCKSLATLSRKGDWYEHLMQPCLTTTEHLVDTLHSPIHQKFTVAFAYTLPRK